MVPESQEKWNKTIIDVLDAYIKICKEYNLRYYCVGGTAIGAVRHNAMIPWDDDIDVCMPRPDYNRFLEICANTDMGIYEIVSPYSNSNYPLYSLKMCDKRTTLMENKFIPCVTGLYIDIFPVDGTSDNFDKALRLKRQFRKLDNRLTAISTRYTFGKYIGLLGKSKEWGQFVYKTIAFFFRKAYRRSLLNQMKNICGLYDFNSAKNVIIYTGSYDKREIYPKEWINGAKSFAFENLTVDLPVEYDKYLHHFFDEYMQLPPENERVAKHDKAYINMNKRESLVVVKNKIKHSR